MSTSIFTFDHGQKKLNKAIGVEEVYLDELSKECADTIKDFIFDDKKQLKEDISPSQLLEIVQEKFSYSQLVIMSTFYLQDKIKRFEEEVTSLSSSKLKAMLLAEDDLPQEIKDLLDKLKDSSEDED
jgi:hypothetical protein